MKLSAPIYRLKRQAKLLSREQNVPLHEALDRIALEEGFGSWALLAARTSALSPAKRFFARLVPGDLVLLGARPGQGKTLMSLELAFENMKQGNRSVFFTLEYTEKDVRDRFRDLGVEWAQFQSLFTFDGSNAISADYIMRQLADAPANTFVIIDYLQLLDQRRENPALTVQVEALKRFARARGLTVVFISQIDRTYDPSKKPYPDSRDVRLPNPLDLALFDKKCFLSNGKARFQAVATHETR